MGYLLAPVYLVFLSILMTALVAKIVAMSFVGGRNYSRSFHHSGNNPFHHYLRLPHAEGA